MADSVPKCGKCGETMTKITTEATCQSNEFYTYKCKNNCQEGGEIYYYIDNTRVACAYNEENPKYVYEWKDENSHYKLRACQWCGKKLENATEHSKTSEHSLPIAGDGALMEQYIRRNIINNDEKYHSIDYYCPDCYDENVEKLVGDIISELPAKEEHKLKYYENDKEITPEDGKPFLCGRDNITVKCDDCPYEGTLDNPHDVIKVVTRQAKYTSKKDGPISMTHDYKIQCSNPDCDKYPKGGTAFIEEIKNELCDLIIIGAKKYNSNKNGICVQELYYCSLCKATYSEYTEEKWDEAATTLYGKDGGPLKDYEKTYNEIYGKKSSSSKPNTGTYNPGGYTGNTPTTSPDQECEHDYSKIVHDEYIHWSVCSKCNTKMENSEVPHTFDEAVDDGGTTGTHSATCNFEGCGYKQTSAHDFDENGQCSECSATQNSTGCEHDYSETGNDDIYHWTKCSKCGEIEETSKQEHTLGEYENNYDGTHSAKCTKEGCNNEDVSQHEFGNDGNCTACDATACDEGEHDFSIQEWNDDEHWLSCVWCGTAKKDSIESHEFDEWTTNAEGKQEAMCTNPICGYIAVKDASDAPGDGGGILGDINSDGSVDVTDLLILKRHILAEMVGNNTEWILTGNTLTLADLNSDGSVDVTDLLKLKRIILASMV